MGADSDSLLVLGRFGVGVRGHCWLGCWVWVGVRGMLMLLFFSRCSAGFEACLVDGCVERGCHRLSG
ncbi:hypothetical protein BS50DRAFT_304419 [Corynespora cassiicola Philippines]|uniref:Transmembrane protein n=1 Tax=Corynespora cassiicola Philippines TaxID=1448308 RepID=A0A2T2NXD0_CORCC|nr:hypothetical protein BS50DRAFT_304419 [Corynespora cassiicola Philippines]